MKRFLSLIAGLTLALTSMTAPAAASGSIHLNWELPLTGCSVAITPCDNAPLTGDNALVAVDVYLSTSPIADDAVLTPTVSLAAGVTTTTATLDVNNGDTIYGRIKVRNQFLSSDYGLQVTKLVTLPIKPGVATNVTIAITINGGAPAP